MDRERVASLNSIDAVVGDGKAVISADDSIIVAMMQAALRQGRSATFYVSPDQGAAVMRWYWTSGRIKETGMEAVSNEERTKIESELGIKCVGGTWFTNRIECPRCGSVYGMFEFMQQGLREHDRDWINSVFELKNTAVVLGQSCPRCFMR